MQSSLNVLLPATPPAPAPAAAVAIPADSLEAGAGSFASSVESDEAAPVARELSSAHDQEFEAVLSAVLGLVTVPAATEPRATPTGDQLIGGLIAPDQGATHSASSPQVVAPPWLGGQSIPGFPPARGGLPAAAAAAAQRPDDIALPAAAGEVAMNAIPATAPPRPAASDAATASTTTTSATTNSTAAAQTASLADVKVESATRAALPEPAAQQTANVAETQRILQANSTASDRLPTTGQPTASSTTASSPTVSSPTVSSPTVFESSFPSANLGATGVTHSAETADANRVAHHGTTPDVAAIAIAGLETKGERSPSQGFSNSPQGDAAPAPNLAADPLPLAGPNALEFGDDLDAPEHGVSHPTSTTSVPALNGAALNSAAGKAAPVQAERPVSQQLADALVSWQRVVTENGTMRFSAWLSPPELGSVWVELTRSAKGLTARIAASDDRVQALLEAQAPALKQTLADAGVNLSDIDLSGGSEHGPPQHEPLAPDDTFFNLPRGRDGKPATGFAPSIYRTGQIDIRA